MAYTTVNKSTDYFNTKLYTGNGSTQTITGVGFQPDFMWIKERSGTSSHALINAVSGINKKLMSNSTDVESTETNYITAVSNDGFSVGQNNGINQSGITNVAWNWKANGAGSSNTDGTITSTVSANTTSGFSIVKWVGTNATGTVGHGLGATPKLVIYKNLNDSTYWYFTTTAIDGSHDLLLWPVKDAVQPFSASVPTSSVLNLIANNDTNGSSDNIIAYCFAEKQGFSKFGTYVGNGNSNGTFVYTGFKPAFVLVKMYTSTSNGNWTMHDNRRSSSGGFNHIDKTLYPHLSNSEDTGNGRGMDMFSNGFKFTGNDEGNTNNQNYIYMAFAEAPLVGSNNVPCTAR